MKTPVKIILVSVFTLIICSFSVAQEKSKMPKASEGKIERLENFNSKYVTPRNIDIWLPKNYSKQEKYAVLYMHDGQMLYDSTTTWNKQEWEVDEVVSRLIKEDKIKKCIVVGIWNAGKERHPDYFPAKAFELLSDEAEKTLRAQIKEKSGMEIFPNGISSDRYLKFIVEELKPYIDKNYSVLSDKENTFIAGSSMGGLISMYAVCEYPQIFKGAACISTHWPGVYPLKNNPVPKAFADYMKANLPDAELNKFYFDYGTETLDAHYEPHQLMIDKIMKEKGYSAKNWKTLKFEGENHSERSWQKRFDIPVLFLLKK
ncbi:MAG: alpha/beta hydrolase [Rhodothermaceae bacterium]